MWLRATELHSLSASDPFLRRLPCHAIPSRFVRSDRKACVADLAPSLGCTISVDNLYSLPRPTSVRVCPIGDFHVRGSSLELACGPHTFLGPFLTELAGPSPTRCSRFQLETAHDVFAERHVQVRSKDVERSHLQYTFREGALKGSLPFEGRSRVSCKKEPRCAPERKRASCRYIRRQPSKAQSASHFQSHPLVFVVCPSLRPDSSRRARDTMSRLTIPKDLLKDLPRVSDTAIRSFLGTDASSRSYCFSLFHMCPAGCHLSLC